MKNLETKGQRDEIREKISDNHVRLHFLDKQTMEEEARVRNEGTSPKEKWSGMARCYEAAMKRQTRLLGELSPELEYLSRLEERTIPISTAQYLLQKAVEREIVKDVFDSEDETNANDYKQMPFPPKKSIMTPDFAKAFDEEPIFDQSRFDEQDLRGQFQSMMDDITPITEDFRTAVASIEDDEQVLRLHDRFNEYCDLLDREDEAFEKGNEATIHRLQQQKKALEKRIKRYLKWASSWDNLLANLEQNGLVRLMCCKALSEAKYDIDGLM